MDSTLSGAVQVGSAGRMVGPGYPALIVAEIGQNHNGRIDLAQQLIDAAAWAGADAVKVVKRDLTCELTREARDKPYESPHSYGKTYGEHRRALELSPRVHSMLRARAAEHGLLYLATACDEPSAELLDSLDIDAFKIASRDLGNGPLLANIGDRGKPVFVSTGMSSLDEVDAAIELLNQHTTQTVLMQCTSLYPTPFHHAHLRSIATLAERYSMPVGFSDHTRGILVAPIAVALGAAVIEKHFTLDRHWKGTDHALSVTPDEMRQMIENIRMAERALGREDKPVAEGVLETRAKLGRSLVTRVPIPAGTQVSESMLTLKSPGTGVPWVERDRILGRRAQCDLPPNSLVRLDDVA